MWLDGDWLHRLREKYAAKEGVVTLQRPTLPELLEKAVLRVTRNYYRMTDENTIALGNLMGAVGAEAMEFSKTSAGPVKVKRFTLRDSECGVEMNPMQKGPPPPPSSSDSSHSDATAIIVSSKADSDDEFG